VKQYYDLRAPAYDDWYLGRGRYAGTRDEEAWRAELASLIEVVAALPPVRTLDVACGTGFLTRHLAGEVVGLDASPAMLEQARRQAPNAKLLLGDALALPVADAAFDRVLTGHFYGHLDGDERRTFLGEARRVAPELVVVDAAVRPDHDGEEVQHRLLDDGSEWPILKRYFTPEQLATELGGGDTLFDGDWFVAVQA
jgi:demethylmenaquinone methyltransferase/2-methoxy-6-polyprenyl-1,4-benzoquinol methylase